MKYVSTFLTLAACFLLIACQHDNRYEQMMIRLADSQMAHDTCLWQSDGAQKPKWDYTQGLIARAMTEVYKLTGDEVYLAYVKDFADYFIREDGQIETFKKSDFNIDRVNGGTFLLTYCDLCPEPRFEAAMDTLYSQLKDQPRTSEGGFWHKKRYPWQMWLDGLYMGEPFYVAYAERRGLTEAYDDILLQFATVDKHTYDPATGLNYHGWDESREQQWADSITGCSPHFWGRAMGWYLMAMVDVLDHMPKEHEGCATLQSMLQRSAANILRYQDPETHLWYQVLDHQGDTDNYLEATCSAMFCYTFAKGANMGYLPKEYKQHAEDVFDGIAKHLIVENEDGTISLTECCAVAGLGGDPYRDGTYEYYVHEKKRNDDPKGIGPLILATIELAK